MRTSGTGGMRAAVALAAGAVALSSFAPAPASVVANPATLAGVVAGAADGASIVLAAGDYGRVTLRERRFARPITLDARAARFEQLVLRNVSGVTVAGGTVQSPDDVLGVFVDGSDHVTVGGMTVSGARVGITLRRSKDVVLENNVLAGVRSDGINIGMSQRVRVEGNQCRDFHPASPTYDAAGKMSRDGDHPDCIQGWSRPNDPPTADVTVIGNRADGTMQGVFFGNAQTGGVDDGGFDRIAVKDNDLTVGMYNAIMLDSARSGLVTGNRVRGVPGARNPWRPHGEVTPWIRLARSEVTACGNQVQGKGASVSRGLGKCPKAGAR